MGIAILTPIGVLLLLLVCSALKYYNQFPSCPSYKKFSQVSEKLEVSSFIVLLGLIVILVFWNLSEEANSLVIQTILKIFILFLTFCWFVFLMGNFFHDFLEWKEGKKWNRLKGRK